MDRLERYLPIASLAGAAGVRDATEAYGFSGYEGQPIINTTSIVKVG